MQATRSSGDHRPLCGFPKYGAPGHLSEPVLGEAGEEGEALGPEKNSAWLWEGQEVLVTEGPGPWTGPWRGCGTDVCIPHVRPSDHEVSLQADRRKLMTHSGGQS